MDKERLRSIVSGLGSCELTYLEKQFVGRVKEYCDENWVLTEQQESILEGIYREKVRRIKKRSRQAEDCLAKSSVWRVLEKSSLTAFLQQACLQV